MQINEDQLYAILISSLLSNKEWTLKFKSNENSTNKIIVEDYLKKFDSKRYMDLLNILKKHIPLFVDSRIISTIQNPKNNLDTPSDELWVTCISYLTQANVDPLESQNIIFDVDYQNIPLYIPKYVHLPNGLMKELNQVIKLKLEDMSVSEGDVVSIPYNISSYDEDIVSVIYGKDVNQRFKQFCLELKSVILQDEASSQHRYNKDLMDSKDFPQFLISMIIVLFDIVSLGILFFIENQVFPNGNIDTVKFPITFKSKNFTINDIQDFVLDMANTDVGTNTISNVIKNNSLFLSNQYEKTKKQKTIRNAILGTTALGLAYMLFNNKTDDSDEDEDD